MLTVNYLQRSPFRWKFALLIILMITALAVTFSFQINHWLPDYIRSFSNLIAQQFHTKISFRTVLFRFPDHIVFKNVQVLTLDRKDPMLQASRVTMSFFNTIIIRNLAVNFPAVKDYLKRHGKKLHTWAQIFPKGKMNIQVPDGRFYRIGPAKEDPTAFTIDLGLDHDNVKAQGAWGDKNKFNYKLKGKVLDPGFELDNLTVDNDRSSMSLWGHWFDKSIDWKGFILYEKFYILDIDGQLQLQTDDLVLKKLSFTINGDDVLASGHCVKKDLSQCDADIALKDNRLHFHSRKTSQGLVYKGWANVDGSRVAFDDLTARIVNGNILKLRIKQIQGTLSIKGKEHRVSLEDLWASISVRKPYQKAVTLSAKAYAGDLNGRFFLDTSSLPWRVRGHGDFERIDLNRLSDDFSYFERCHGLLTGLVDIQSSSAVKLTGTFNLHNGNFNGSRFQEWMVRTLQMPSLDHVSDADLSGHFSLDGGSKMLDELNLKTEDFDLNGFFHIDEDDLVAAQASVRFSKGLLRESPVGRDIMGLVHGAWTLPFEFELSGNVYRMNFQWDNSPLKDKVRQHLFSFFERMIDRRTDAHPSYNVTIPSESVSPG